MTLCTAYLMFKCDHKSNKAMDCGSCRIKNPWYSVAKASRFKPLSISLDLKNVVLIDWYPPFCTNDKL